MLPSLFLAQQKFSSAYTTVLDQCPKCGSLFVEEIKGAHGEHISWSSMNSEVKSCQKVGCDGQRYKPPVHRAEKNAREENSSPPAVANKRLWYFNPVLQLCNRVWYENFESQLEPIPKSNAADNDQVPHIHYSKLCDKWRKYIYFKEPPIFQAGGIVLFLSFCADGFKPWKNVVYSISFAAMRILSYAQQHGYTREKLIMVGITQGPDKPASLDPLVRLLVADLNRLALGVKCQNPMSFSPLETKLLYAYLIIAVGDYPGLTEFFGLVNHTAYDGCYKCRVQQYKVAGTRQMCSCRFHDMLSEGDETKLINDGFLRRSNDTRQPVPLRKDTEFVVNRRKEFPNQDIVSGIKFIPGWDRLLYHPMEKGCGFMDLATADECHTIRRQLTNLITSIKGKTSLAEWPKPVLKLSEIMSEGEKKKAQEAYDKKIIEWQSKEANQSIIRTDLGKFSLDKLDQKKADVRYAWAAIPGLSDPHGSIFQRSGEINIHEALHLMSTKLLLYCLYPFADSVLYNVLVGLVDIWRVIIDATQTVQQLKDYYPTFVLSMAKWESHAPFSCLGMLFHITDHIYKYRITAGSCHEHWMFIFERLVSFLIRLIKSRSNPEANLANKLAIYLHIQDMSNYANSMAVVGVPLDRQSGPLYQRMMKSLITDNNNFIGPSGPPYILPKRLSKYKANLLTLNDVLAECSGPHHEELSELFKVQVTKSESTIASEIYKFHGSHINVNGLSRCTVGNEPRLGSPEKCVRMSGFVLPNHNGKFVGRIVEFYVVDKKDLYIKVVVYQLLLHEDSQLDYVDRAQETIAIIPAESIGNYRSFVPWTDKSQNVNIMWNCVLHKPRVDTHAT